MPKSLFPYRIFFVSILFFVRPYHASVDFVRQLPRPFVFTPHNRPQSHPQQVHVSLVGKNYMKVSWVTDESRVPSAVDYGTAPGKYDSSATGEHTSYHYFLYGSGKIHHVTIGPLFPATTYYYRCGGSGPEFNFRTPPASFPIEFAVAGDLGQTGWTTTTLEHINATKYDVLLLPGDLSYADTQQPLWDSFGRLVEPYASRRPWMVTQGNHEQETFPFIYPNGRFKAYNSRWPMPYEESGSKSNLYYSFDVVGTHIIMLGSYADFSTDSDQYRWLANDVAKIDRLRTPWVVAIIHAPWYNSNLAHQGEGESMRVAIEEMLYNSRVDIVFAGHVHAYERFTRIYDNNADPCGPIYITIGDGGNREGLAMLYKEPKPSFSTFREASFGHGRLRIMNNTHAHWSWHRNNDSIAVVADETWIQSLSSLPSCIVQIQAKLQLTQGKYEL